ncbi:MAG: YfhO family protein [Nitrospinae bacterium]|nr:YfhO family protein [Nitrospinota bacterium]
MSLSSYYNQFHSAVWFPLILMMWQKYFVNGHQKYFCGAAIFLSFQVLGGGPEHAIFSVLIIYAYSLYLDKEKAKGFVRKSLAIFLLVFMALALSAIQWIPTFAFLKEIIRGSGLNYGTSTLWSLSPATFLELFLPLNLDRFLEMDERGMNYYFQSFYMGVLPLFVFFSCLIAARDQKIIRFWLMVFGAGVFFSLGKFNPLYSLFHEWVPIFNMFRFPQKFFFLCAFALVFLLGLSLDWFVERIDRSRSTLYKLIFSLFITAVGVAAIFGMHGDRHGLETLLILLLFALSIYALHLKKISSSKFLYFLLFLIVMDLMGKNSMVVPMIDKEFYTEPPALVQRLGGSSNSYRIYSGALLDSSSKAVSGSTQEKQEIATPQPKKTFYNMLAHHLATRDKLSSNAGTIYDVAYVNGEATMPMKTTSRWYKWFTLSEIPVKKLILKRSNVRYWVTDEPDPNLSDKNQGIVNKVEVFEDALPRAFLVGDSITMPEADLLKYYYDSRFNPLKQVLLTEPVSVEKTENFFGQVEKLRYSPNRVNIKTNQNGEGFLVLLDTYFHGWEVTVDGIAQPIYRANSFYRAVKLGPGNHDIRFSYTPVGLKMGVYISSMALILLLFLFIKSTREKI